MKIIRQSFVQAIGFMSFPLLNNLHFASADQNIATNGYGETPLPYAPKVEVTSGQFVVPQQYLDVHRTLSNLEEVLANIQVPAPFLLFAGEQDSLLYITVGIIGEENYPSSVDQHQRAKIVYGRRWLIEDTTPTSEIVQTALLAVKKAREHELRERIKVRAASSESFTTPFNNHQDLPLMARSKTNFDRENILTNVEAQLSKVCVDGLVANLVRLDKFSECMIAEIKLTGSCKHFQDFENKTLIVNFETAKEFLHAFTYALIALSDRYVEEALSFEGFTRFSWQIDVFQLAEFSRATRNVHSSSSKFKHAFQDMSYKVDSAKAPKINTGNLGQYQTKLISTYSSLDGYLPHGDLTK